MHLGELHAREWKKYFNREDRIEYRGKKKRLKEPSNFGVESKKLNQPRTAGLNWKKMQDV